MYSQLYIPASFFQPNRFIGIIVTMAAFFFSTFSINNAHGFNFFNNRLIVRGNIQQTLNLRTHEDSRDIRYSSFRTMMRLEGNYSIKRNSNIDISLYGLANYYYDEGLDLDSNQRHAIRNESGKRHYRDFRSPRHSREWLKELYVDIKYNIFQIRVGKQLVSWGETAESRVADLINPLDMKYLIAFPDWEDFKLGLCYYTPANAWQDLSLEVLIIPYFFEATRMPTAGSGLFFGSPQLPNYTMQNMFDKQRRDEPEDSFNNIEFGARIRGKSSIGEGIDWTISYFYTRLDSPLVAESKGYRRLNRIILGLQPGGKVYSYPYYNSFAFTFATTWDKIGSSVRGESTLNTKRDYQYGSYKIKERDLLTVALQLSKETMVPWLSEWNRSTAVSITLTAYQYWLLNHEFNKHTGDYIQGETGKDASLTKFTLTMSTGFLFYTVIPMLNLIYDTNGKTSVVAALVYKPGDHWQWMCSYQQLNEQGIARYQDQVIFSIRYEFW